MTDENGWTTTYRAADEGSLALSRIFHLVGRLRDILEADPPADPAACEHLDDLFYAARELQAYISGLKAQRG